SSQQRGGGGAVTVLPKPGCASSSSGNKVGAAVDGRTAGRGEAGKGKGTTSAEAGVVLVVKPSAAKRKSEGGTSSSSAAVDAGVPTPSSSQKLLSPTPLLAVPSVATPT